jgi:hypothetical protein
MVSLRLSAIGTSAMPLARQSERELSMASVFFFQSGYPRRSTLALSSRRAYVAKDGGMGLCVSDDLPQEAARSPQWQYMRAMPMPPLQLKSWKKIDPNRRVIGQASLTASNR